MKIYGYCRVSTPKQSLDRQIKNISSAYPEAEIVTETYSGTTTDRPQWIRLKKTVLKQAEQGEHIMIVFDSVSRMSRNAVEGFREYQEFLNAGIALIFLKEPHINTDTYKATTSNVIDFVGDEIADIYIQATNKVIMLLAEKQIKLAFDQSQKEVDDLHTRTSEGMKASGAGEKIRKARTGRTFETVKSKTAKKIIRQHSKTFGGSLSDAECQALARISRNTFYTYKKQIKEESL